MRAGALDKRLLIQRSSNSQDATGAVTTSWVDVGLVWARISPIRGNEAALAGQTLASMDTRILIRYHTALADINADWRCSHADTIYNVVSIANIDTANKAIELLCKSGLNSG